MLHILRFCIGQDKLCHPLPNNWRELETVHTDRKVPPQVDFLACALPVCYSTMFYHLFYVTDILNQEKKLMIELCFVAHPHPTVLSGLVEVTYVTSPRTNGYLYPRK
jgi:hypothetical protein